MAKEILLYNEIYSYTAERFINSLNDAAGEDISIRLNCNGGSPEDGWGMIAKFIEHAKNKEVKVDGKAYSMGTFFLCYVKSATALDVSEFLIHRAAYSSWFEKSEYMTSEMWGNLDRINKSLRAALEAKINVKKFEKLKGVTLDEIFSNETRIDVFLNAREAKDIGLISDYTKITPEKQSEINALMIKIAAEYNGFKVDTQVSNNPIISNSISSMTIEQLKAENPALYNQIVAIGEAKGVTKERDRVGAFLAFVAIDPEAVSKGIKEGNEMSQTAMAEFTLKAINAKSLKAIEADSSKDVKTEEVDGKSPEAKNIDAFQAEVRKQLNLK